MSGLILWPTIIVNFKAFSQSKLSIIIIIIMSSICTVFFHNCIPAQLYICGSIFSSILGVTFVHVFLVSICAGGVSKGRYSVEEHWIYWQHCLFGAFFQTTQWALLSPGWGVQVCWGGVGGLCFEFLSESMLPHYISSYFGGHFIIIHPPVDHF